MSISVAGWIGRGGAALATSAALLLASVGASSAASCTAASGSCSGNVNITSGIRGGALTLDNLTNRALPDVTLDGSDKIIQDFSLGSLKIIDATGTGSGWKLQIAGTNFADATSGRSLPATALTLKSVTLDAAHGTNPSGRAVGSVTPVTLSGPILGATAPNPQTFYSAAQATGLGAFDVSPTFDLAVAADTYAGTYTSQITISLVNTP